MKYYVAAKETGALIEECKSYSEAAELISRYEALDKEEGIYEEGFYDVVDEHHITITP